MWTDIDTSEDLIGFRVHADLIRSVVTDASLLPVTIGVFGDWGGGKTSIMRMLEQDLAPERYTNPDERVRYEKVACLYVNGWLFEGYDDAKAALLSSVLLALGEHKRFGPKVRDKAASLLKSVNWMRVARLGLREVALPAIAAYATGGASLVPTAAGVLGRLTDGLFGGTESSAQAAPEGAQPAGGSAEQAEERGTDNNAVDWEALIKRDPGTASPLDVRSFRERFAAMLMDSDIDTLVVLIDDLDRCSPERIVDNLEAIKLFLNVPGTAFVIGADPRIVRQAIAHRYRTGAVEREVSPADPASNDETGEAAEAQERLISDYLEKLIQIPYWLPRLSPTEIETYMTLLFCRRDLEGEAWTRCLTACDDQRRTNRYGVFGYAAVQAALGGGELQPPSLAASLAFSTSAAPLITEGLKGNPRQVKRFLNAFVLREKLAHVAGLTNVRDDVLVKLMILEYANPMAFRQLFTWQAAQQGFPAELRAMEAAYAEEDTPRRAALRGPKRPEQAPRAGRGSDGASRDEDAAERPPRGDAGRRGTADRTPAARSGAAADLPWDTEFLRRWVRMAPPLAEVDLRDYFWVARDRLASTFTGLSMVPPLVRRAVEGLLSENPGHRTAALTAVAELEANHRSTLLELLGTQITRHPEQKVGYDAFRALLERLVPDAAAAFREVAVSVPVDRVPAAVGLDLRTLRDQQPVLAPELDAILARWSAAPNTPVGRALAPRGTRSTGGATRGRSSGAEH